MPNLSYTNGTFRMTALDLIKASMRACRVLIPGNTLHANEITDSIEALNMLLKSYSSKGLKLWSHKQHVLTAVAATKTYEFGVTYAAIAMPESAIDVTQINIKEIAAPYTEYAITKYSRDEWRNISNKSLAGTPSAFYFDPVVSLRSDLAANYRGQLQVWPVPNAAFVAGSSLVLHYVEPLADITLATDYVEIPATWYRAVKWNLALEMAPEFDVPPDTYNRIAAMAVMTMTEAENSDGEFGTSIIFGADS